MHFLCIPIILAVATRLVDVAAHAKASAIVSTDGQFETQRHLRVHAHDKDDDERTFPEFDEVTSSKIFKELMEIVNPTTATSTSPKELMETVNPTTATSTSPKELMEIVNPTTATSTFLKDASDTTSLKSNQRKRLRDKTFKVENKAPKKKPRDLDLFLAALQDAQKQNKDTEQGEEPMISLSEVTHSFEKKNVPRLFRTANERLLEANTDPQEVFKLYGLQFLQFERNEERGLYYWYEYVDLFNRKNSTKTLLLDTLAKYYDFDDLLGIKWKIYSPKIKERVKAEFDNLFPANITPEESFNKFGLSEDADKLLDNKNFLFWLKYVPYFNSRNNDNVTISSILDKYS